MNSTWKAGKMAVVLLFVLAACRSGPPRISIEGAKAELSGTIIGEAAVSMNIVNRGGADTLTGVKTNIAGATVVLHAVEGQRMVTREKMTVPAKSALDFTMHGSHIMVENLPKDMKEGSELTLILLFEKSGEMPVRLALQKASPMPMDHSGHH